MQMFFSLVSEKLKIPWVEEKKGRGKAKNLNFEVFKSE